MTAVCGTKNVELVRSLGADEVVDYQKQDYTKNGETYDVILDAVGFHSFSHCRGSIVPGGIFVPTELGRFHLENLLLTLATKWLGKRRVRFGVARWSKRDVLRRQGADRGRGVPGRDRPVVPAGGRGRGDAVRRDAAEDRQRRPDGGRPMRAVVHDRYGPPDVLRLAEVEKPVPNEDELLVRIHATTVNRSDCGWRAPHPFFSRFFTGLLRPRRPILGSELAGVVEAVGSGVTSFEVGDEVFGIKAGAHAEYVCAREGAALAQQARQHELRGGGGGLRRRDHRAHVPAEGRLRQGQSIVVYGASGSIGTAAVQLAKHFGADVTAVCNTKNVELVRSLGADEVVDYTARGLHRERRDLRRRLRLGRQALVQALPALGEAGRRLPRDRPRLPWHVPLLALLTRWIGDKRVTMPIPRYTKEEVVFLKELIEAGSTGR